MTAELIDYINKLNIYVYVLSDGSTVIGKLVEVHESSIEVIGLCSMESIIYDDSIEQLLLPIIPQSLEQTSIIALGHVMIQSPASLVLKKSYCDSLLKFKINKIKDPSISSNQSTNINGKLDSKNPFKDRW